MNIEPHYKWKRGIDLDFLKSSDSLSDLRAYFDLNTDSIWQLLKWHFRNHPPNVKL